MGHCHYSKTSFKNANVLNLTFLFIWQEETQRLLRTADNSPLRDHFTSTLEKERHIECLNNALTAKLAARPLLETPVPPPVGYNQGYSPLSKIAPVDSSRECSCTLTRLSSPRRSPMGIPGTAEDVPGVWNSQIHRQEQLQQHQVLASCGYTLPRLNVPNSSARPVVSYISKGVKEGESSATLSEFGASNSSVSTQITSIGESSPDIARFQSLSRLSKPQGTPTFLPNSLAPDADSSPGEAKNKGSTGSLKRHPHSSSRIRSVSFSDDGKTESSV